jgi:hypothetical protein
MKTIARGDAESAEQIMHHHLMAQQKVWRSTQLQPKAPAGANPSTAGSDATAAAAGAVSGDSHATQSAEVEPVGV